MSHYDDQDLLQEILSRISAKHIDQFASLPIEDREKLERQILSLIHSEFTNSQTTPEMMASANLASAKLSLSNLGHELEKDGWKLDITSTREAFFGGLGCFGLILGVFLFFSGSGAFALITIITAIGAAVVRNRTDDHLILSPKEKAILYHKKLLGIGSIESLVNFREINSIAVDGQPVATKEGSYWQYRTVAISQAGKVFALCDYEKDAFDNKAELGFAAAVIVGVPLLPPEPEKRLLVEGSGSRIMTIYVS